ncbi:AMP-binding protein [Kitasatospora sp. NPDC050463]|uniref:class I adenylate-forming enzyme family protein n=1 Tax=Kitasatospora sp. NPDC050463 TaxID=3155786 RepID=UPI0033F61F01
MPTVPPSRAVSGSESTPQIPEATLDELLLPLPPGVGDRPALIDGATGERWSHQEVRERALARAQDARHTGVEPGQRVLLALPNGLDFAAALLGLLAAGAVVSPVDPRTPAPELARRAETIGARTLLGSPEGKLTRLSTGPGGANSHNAGTPAGLALLPWSSGTTASPKPVAVTHRNAVAGLVQLAAAQPLAPDDVLLGALPFCHLFGMQYVLNHALLSGASVVLLPRWNARAALDAAAAHGITVLHAAPPMVHDLAAEAEHPQNRPRPRRPGRLQQVLSGGAPLDPETATRCERALGVPVDGAYGLTEVNTCHFTRRGAARRPGSSGHPVPGTEYRLVTPDGPGDWPTGTGELHLRGPQVAAGHLAPDGRLVAATDSDGWLATGDLARVDTDGCLYVLDRLKDVIKYNGHQISPAEVEAVLRTHPAVADAALVPVPDRRAGQLPLACVVPAAGSHLTPELCAEIKAGRGDEPVLGNPLTAGREERQVHLPPDAGVGGGDPLRLRGALGVAEGERHPAAHLHVVVLGEGAAAVHVEVVETPLDLRCQKIPLGHRCSS